MNAPVAFDSNAYRIRGVPTWLLSGEMHYYKMTRGDWRRRLVQLKCAGFNTVSVYMPWNYHEPVEGRWRFDGDRDVEHFLALAAETGLYVVARPGPYICDEWHAGGLPAWLSAKPGLRLRANDPQFLSHADRWWDRIAPLIRDYELGRKGTIILAQVENEYGHYGEYQEPEYIYHLRDGLRNRGVTVPIINCDSFINFARLRPRVYEGINLCCNFGGDALRCLQRARGLQPGAPLFVTEYWIAAFDWWGRSGTAEQDPQRSLNGALQIAAGGAGGLTAFVFSGGAHFAYWHGRSICSEANFMTTLYGPGAPILDDGRFSPKYALFKNLVSPLARTELAQAGMPRIEESRDGLLRITRAGAGAEFTFYQNRSSEQIRVADLEKDQACVDMTIPAGATSWAVRNLPLPGGFVMKESTLNLLETGPALVLFGEANRSFSLRIEAAGETTVFAPDGLTMEVSGRQTTVRGTVPGSPAPCHARLRSRDRVLDVVILNREAADRCWTVSLPGIEPRLLGGPDRIEDVAAAGERLRVTVSSRERAPLWTLRDHAVEPVAAAYRETAPDQRILLADLEFSSTLPESAPDYDDSRWTHADRPLPMAAFGHGHGWAWYRATLGVRVGGPQMIMLSGADDRAHAFVDGRYLGVRGWGSSKGWHLMPSLTAGEHVLSLLVENLGMFNSGAEFDVPLGEPKGLYGPVLLNGAEVTGWRMRAGLGAAERLDDWPDAGPGDWRPLDADEVKGPVWLRGRLRLPASVDGAVRLELGENAGKGSCWLNGINVGRYWHLGPQQSLWLPLSWLKPDSDIVLFEELRAAPQRLAASLVSFGAQAELEL